MPDPVVLILGCGISGVVAARNARKLLPSSYRLVVIDRDAQASYPPAYLRVMTGERRPEAIRRNRGRLARHGIEFVHAEVRQIDLGERYVRAGSREFHYDYLVVALGFEEMHAPHSEFHHLGSLEGAEHLAAALRYFAGGRILISSDALGFPYPPLPYEIAMLLEDYFHARRVRQKVIISIYTPEPAPLAVLGPAYSDELRSLLAHKGIDLQTEQHIEAMDAAHRVATMAGGDQVSFQMLITEPRQQISPVLVETGLVDETGRIPADIATTETAHENVFAIGDAAYVALPGGEELPRAPGLATRQAQVAAHNIAYRAGHGPRPDPFEAGLRWFIETGNGGAMVAEGDFLASPRQFVVKQPSVLWHLANLAQERYWLWHWY